MLREGEIRQRAHAEKYRGMKDCPACGKGRETDRLGCYKPTRCKDDFHTWFCGNNYTREGCYGHSPGSLRCLDP